MTSQYTGEDAAQQDATAEDTLPPSTADTATTVSVDDVVADLTDAIRIQLDDIEGRLARRLDGQQRQIDTRLTPLEQASAMTKRQMETLLQRTLTPEDFQDVKQNLEAQQTQEAERDELARYREWARSQPTPPTPQEQVAQEYPFHQNLIKQYAARDGVAWETVASQIAWRHPSNRQWRDWKEFDDYHFQIVDRLADEQYRESQPAPEPPTALAAGTAASEQDIVDRYAAGYDGGIAPGSPEALKARELMNRPVNPIRPRPLSQVRR